METRHQTAIILLSDIQEFTKLVREDEENALTILKRHKDVFEKLVAAFKGKLIHHRDDKSLAYFNSSASAVNCAQKLQKELQSCSPEVMLSIGLHRGEIIIDEENVIGSSISVVSHIESIGCAGSIMLSTEVYEQLKEKKGFKFQSLGYFQFADLKRPIEIYALANEGLVVPSIESSRTKGKRVSAKTLRELGLEEENKASIWRLLWKRGVPQVLIGYIVGTWTIIQFVDWAISRYQISNYWTDVLLVLFLTLIPSVLLFVYNKERIAKGKLKLVDKITFPSNILLTSILITITLNTSPELKEKEREAWAEDKAPLIIQELVDKGKSWDAFHVLEEAAGYIGNSINLKNYESELVTIMSCNSEPKGVSIYRKPFNANDSAYLFIGKTPILNKKIYKGATAWMYTLPGYDTILTLNYAYEFTDTVTLNFKLTKIEDSEPGMIHFPASNLSIRIPGIDHIERQPLNEFLVDKFEVTNKEYKKFVDGGGYSNNIYWKNAFIKDGREIPFDEAINSFKDKIGKIGPKDWESGDFPPGKERFPVTGISWYEAAAYAEFVNKSLPTLYHWNRIASTYLGNLITPLSNFSSEGLAPVGHYKGMGYLGTYDIAGNAREWCFNSSNRNGERFILGGAYNDIDYAFTDAGTADPWSRLSLNGFRCIKYLGENENQETLENQIDFYYRDFRNEILATDQQFELIEQQYNYDRTPLNANVEKIQVSSDHWTLEKVIFDAAYENDKIIAYLFLPTQGTPPFQTVIYFPGSGSLFKRQFDPEDDWEIKRLDFIIKQGRAVLFPIYYGTYERGREIKSDYPDETFFYKEFIIKLGKDLRRSIDYLDTKEVIDKDNMGYYGYSWGAALGPLMGAIEDRLKCLILACGGLYHQPAQKEVDIVNFVSHVSQPVLMVNSKQDMFFPMNSSQIPMFELLGTDTERKLHNVYDVSSHIIPRNILSRDIKYWLDTYLGEIK